MKIIAVKPTVQLSCSEQSQAMRHEECHEDSGSFEAACKATEGGTVGAHSKSKLWLINGRASRIANQHLLAQSARRD